MKERADGPSVEPEEIELAERKLWSLCLFDGIAQAKRGHKGDQWWLFTSRARHVGSFYYCCKVVGLCPKYTRRYIRKNWHRFDLTARERGISPIAMK